VKNIGGQQLSLPAEAPIMVLPNALLFPHALLPLYIFEERYRAMLAWALEQQRMFCIALMKPGVTEARTTDDFYHVAGLGLVRACVGREDGTSHLVLQGLARVRFRSFVQDRPFRIAELSEVEAVATDRPEGDALSAKVLELCARHRARGATVPEALDEQLEKTANPSMLCDIVAHAFLRDPFRRQSVLEEAQVATRLALLIQHLQHELE
jgi:Lon protease-like protein